tara:strand:+ start:5 stop:2164 length:2160 start_codon:yes stop_codon:yes gene_type:complete
MVNMREQKDQEILVNNITTFLNTLAYINSFENVSENEQEGSGKQTTQDSLNNALIYNGDHYGNPINQNLHITEVFNRLIANKKSYNYFLDDFLHLRTALNEDNYTGIDKIVANNFTKLSDSDIQNIQNSFLDLYSDPNTHIDSVSLIHYLLVKDGFNKNNRGTFIDLIPAELKKQILNSIDAVQTLFNSNKQTDAAFNRVFGLTKQELSNYLVFNYLQSTSAQYHVKNVDEKTGKNSPVVEIKTEEIIEPEIRPNVITILEYEPKGSTIVDNDSESSALSMTAPKAFMYKGKKYFSVDHAYQVNKTGKFNKAADKDYRKKASEGKIGGYTRETKGRENLSLLTLLVKYAFQSELNKNIGGNSLASYGDILTDATDFTTVDMKDDLSAAYIRGLKQAQSQIVIVKNNKGENIYKNKTNIQIDKRKQIDASSEPFVIDLDKGIATIAMYAGLPTFFNNKVKTPRGQFSQNQNSDDVKVILRENLNKLRQKGITSEYVNIRYGNKPNQFIKKTQLYLPLVMRKTLSDGRTVLLVLNKYQQDGKYQSTSDLNQLLDEGQTQVVGNYAEYTIIEEGPQGSKDQNPTGFLFGNRPSEQQINKFEEDKRDAFAIDMEGAELLDDIDVEEPVDDVEDIDYGDPEDVDIETDDDVNPADVLMAIQSTQDDIINELELSNDALVESFYDSLTSEEQQKLGSKDEIMKAYLSYPKDPNEYIENLKKCYLK